jgi:hypothetical protein
MHHFDAEAGASAFQKKTLVAWRRNFIHDILLDVHRFPKKSADLVKSWIDNLPYISFASL